MKYLSFDIEATGLEVDAHIIEFAMIPFDTKSRSFEESLSRQFYIKCPSYESLEENLNPWVKENNKELIIKAHETGIEMSEFKKTLEEYLNSSEVKSYFNDQKVVLFGKSISAIDLPFLNRDLGWEWMNDHFHHRNLDLSCFTMGLIDMGLLEKGMDSGAKLMEFCGLGDVAHTALEDAVNTAKMYFMLLDRLKS